MIVFELQCGRQHRFEGWFASPEEFERQSAAQAITCPVCSDPGVSRVPSARIKRPTASPPREAPAPDPPQTPATARPQQMTLAAFVDHVLLNSEDVGTRFAEEARKIHRGEVPHRSIRGQSSPEETEALLEEGVPVIPLPIPPKDDWQ